MINGADAPYTYGDTCAAFYDDLYPSIERGLLDCLTQLARGGSVLELGLATGRVAIPLAQAGLDVHGVEASRAMLARFRNKPEAHRVQAVLGDFATHTYAARYNLIFSLVSTFYLLSTRDRQLSCLKQIARHLQPQGVFVNEAYVTQEGGVSATHEYALQLAGRSQSYRVTTLSTPLPMLDAMAGSAGMELRARWSNWNRAPYGDAGVRHISVYGRAEDWCLVAA